MSLDHRDLAPAQEPGQACVQLLDNAVLPGVECRPVRRGCGGGQADAEGVGMTDGPEHLGGLEERLCRNTTAVQAGAADLVLLDEGHPQAGRGAVQGGRIAAWPAAQDDHVVVGHAVATFRTISAICAGWGTTASSSGGLVGVGVFLAPIRATG